jgi:hypothetical protein
MVLDEQPVLENSAWLDAYGVNVAAWPMLLRLPPPTVVAAVVGLVRQLPTDWKNSRWTGNRGLPPA